MKIGIIQNNPHLGAYSSNIESIVRHLIVNTSSKQDLYLTSHMALAGNPWNMLAIDGSFLNSFADALIPFSSAVPQNFKILTQIPSELIEQLGLSELPKKSKLAKKSELTEQVNLSATSWIMLENENMIPFQGAQLNINMQDSTEEKTHAKSIKNLALFAPHLPPCSTANEVMATLDYLRFLDIPENTHALYLSCAFPFCDGLDIVTILCEYATAYALPIFYVNTCGASDGIVYAGSSAIISEKGDVLACLPAFEEAYMEFDFSPNNKSNELDGTDNSGKTDGTNKTGKTGKTISHISKSPSPPMNAEEALFQASSLAIADYAKKTGIKGAIVGMSGGMDSALVACLACEALGHENVIGVMMPSPYSSDHSIADAKKLMQNLDMKIYTVPINDTMKAFGESLPEELFAQKHQPSVMENIQARSRGVLLMAFANQTSFMVLGTSNKSESAMGYCTLYGDTVGALEPIGDMYKTRVYLVAQWFNKWKEKEIIPQHIFDKAPSAELKPDQKDQDTLPPYELIDGILEQILENGLSTDQISNFEKNDIQFVLKKLQESEFKRKQCPPVVQLSFCPLGVEWNMPSITRLF